jgi:hypothetical protein
MTSRLAPIAVAVTLFMTAGIAAAFPTSKPGGGMPPSGPPQQKVTTVKASGELIDKVIEKYGGAKAVKKLAAYRMTGTIESFRDKETAPFTRSVRRPDGLMVDIRYTANPEKRYLLGNEGWRTGKDGIAKKVEGFQLHAMALQAARADIPWILSDRREELQQAEMPLSDGRKGYLFILDLKNGMTVRYFVDAETFLVISSEGMLAGGPMGSISFATYYEDFKPVAGVQVPHREINFTAGQKSGITVIEKVEANPKLKDKEFKP